MKINNYSHMQKKTIYSTILNWLNKTEMFVRPSKKLPGKWQMFEYYFEPEKELKHITEEKLNENKQHWDIEFTEDEKYFHNSNLSVLLISGIENGTWSISKNFITLIHPHNYRNNVEFQFAIEKGNLKLLKKDEFGKIDFFGFFRREDLK